MLPVVVVCASYPPSYSPNRLCKTTARKVPCKVSNMTAGTEEKYEAGTGPEDFSQAEDPPEDISAGEGEAPFGWTRDRKTGELRPKRRPGRPAVPPGPEQVIADEPVERAADRPPGDGKDKDKRPKGTPPPAPPMPRGGVIATGVNKLYRRAGRIIRAMDEDIGNALIECTKPGEDDELTVGEAWENLCKVNPRIRRFLLKAISGGAWGDLVFAHAPIGIALMMKPWVRKLIPLERLVSSMAEPDEDTPEGEGNLPGGMTEADFGQMKDLAEHQARAMARRMGVNLTDAELAEASAAAMAGGPPSFRRQQPRRMTKAQRRGAPG